MKDYQATVATIAGVAVANSGQPEHRNIFDQRYFARVGVVPQKTDYLPDQRRPDMGGILPKLQRYQALFGMAARYARLAIVQSRQINIIT